MARKPSMRHHAIGELEDVNLVPIMSVLVILIPMLLYAFTFFEVTVQAVAAPKMGTGKSAQKETDQKRPLNLTVLVSADGFLVKYDDGGARGMGDEGAPIKKVEFPPDELHGNLPYKDYDYPELHNRLQQMKERFPDELQVNIGAEMNIPWYIIARTIDAARLKLQGAPFQGDERMVAYAKATPVTLKKGGETEPVHLFPSVVFVVAE